MTRRWISSRPVPSGRCSWASARTERSVRTRTRSRSSAPRRTCMRRATSSTTSSTTRRSRARRPCRTCASGRSRSARPTSYRRPASSAAITSGCSTGPSARPGGTGRDAAAQLRAAARRGLGCAAPAGCRRRSYDESLLAGAPPDFRSAPLDTRGLPDTRFTLQVYVEDCTGCELCVQVCPVTAPGDQARKAINLAPREPLVAAERDNIAFFETLPVADRSRVDFGTVRGTQFLKPLFEFSGACAGCGETPYVKLLSQLFGDRLMVANATGCSSIYGGNLPTTPWTADADGRGPAWSNSLFEDNAEFGLGFRLTADRHAELARSRLTELRDAVGAELADDILGAAQLRESELRDQHARVGELKRRLDDLGHRDGPAADLRSVVDHLLRRSVWIVGGDGWAYDIGSGGLDHVLASGRNVNVLVLDTEVYSNTGGQSSKATPLGAVAKFAAAGKTMPKKDLALQAIAYGYV